ncbi:uncharacterized protein LOC126672380 [Mercurialis annua]|uniref:uncharacterized protein LOC126672380 n=1 Tax=Mercurialis annua TaxID=3986 RepID=UPI00215F2BD6|nr:uncharacterized protein LOC126672380 [Mercurialis annua]
MVSTHNLSFIGLIESKKEVVNDFLVNKLWPNLDYKFDFIPSIGASGGLLLIWNSILLRNVIITKGHRCIVMDFVFEARPCRHILIYASNVALERELFWRQLNDFLNFMGTIFISGDFNETLHLEERLNATVFTPSMLALRDLINNAKMLDLPLQGRTFTWQNSHSRSRIDRCLVSASVSALWPRMSLSSLPRGQSDHVSICFKSDKVVDWGPKPFRSIDAWWEHEEFEEFAKQIKELSAKILLKEIAGDAGVISEEEKQELSSLREDMWTAEKRLESLWVQKSRLKWNTAGDRNTKFFHNMASVHYRNNFISSIQFDDLIYTEPKDIRFYIREFYSRLYSRGDIIQFDITGLQFSSLLPAESDSLVTAFSEEEIFAAICSCGEKKAPGPDGFNFFFYKKAWPFMKDMFVEFFSDFFRFNILPKGINTSFMVLVPKVAGSANVKDYRPISLVNR